MPVFMRPLGRLAALPLLASVTLTLAQGTKPPLTVEIVATREADGRLILPHAEEFEVRLKNTSAKSVAVWDRHCEPGHPMLSFSVKGPDGERPAVQVRKVADMDWSEYPPKQIVIPPGKDHRVKISLSEFFGGVREWENVPEPNTGETLEMKAVWEIKPAKAGQQKTIWTGRIESAPQKVRVVNPALTTPQHYLWNNCPGQGLKLLQNDPSLINKKDPENSCTPLHHAARFAFKEAVVWLLANGADVNAAAYNGFTPIHLTEKREIAELLIKAGAKLEQKDTWGKTALQDAAEEGRHEVVDALLAAGSKMDLATALVLKKRDLAIQMLIHDPEIIVGGDGGGGLHGNVTPLGLAAELGDMELVKILLEAGAPVNDPTRNPRYGGTVTPLCNAVWAEKAEMVEFLLKKGAATDVVGGKFFRSITDYATKHSDKRIVELLNKYKTNPGVSPASSPTPEAVKNKLPGRIASGDFKLPDWIKDH